MGVLHTLVRRARQFGLRRSAAVYLVIVVGLVLASELAIEHIVGQGEQSQGVAVTGALAIAALVGVFVFFLFQGAVEDREQAGVALANSEERFRSLTALSADWFWETDADHRISWIAGSQSMLKLFGSELAYGRRFWEISGIKVRAGALEGHLEALAARGAFHELELCRPGRDGASEYHLISGEPRSDAAGRLLGYRGVGRDVTAAKRAEAAISGAKERLELALDSGAHAIWDSDLATGRIYLSEGWAHIVGKSSGAQWCVLGDLVGLVHEQDLEAILLASRKAIKGETASFGAEIRLRTAGGDWKWAMAAGKVVERGPDGRVTRMSGTVVDIDRGKRAEHALRDAEARYRTLVDLSPDGVLLQSDGRIEYANRAAADILGAPRPSALVGMESMRLVHADDYEAIHERVRYLRAGPGKSDFLERRLVRLDGGVVTVEGASVSYLERGRLVVQTVLRDITERVQAREALAVREQRFRDVVEAAGEYVWETDSAFRYTWLSARVEAVLGHVHADLIGRRPQDFMPLGEARSVEERLMQASRNGAPFRDLVHRSITKSGRAIWQSISGVPVFDRSGTLKGFRGTGSDITSRRQAEERIQYLATRDALTGLPNRVLLSDRAGQAILDASRKGGRMAVLSLSLDRFHLVNDSLGHRAGDALLRAVAERLSYTTRRDDTLARLGADEFALLWDGTRDSGDAAQFAQKVLNCLAQPVVVEGRSLKVSASIGIGMFPGDGAEFAELLRNADAARYAAREADGNAFRFYSGELNARALGRLDAESALHRALERGEFELHYQPVVRSRGGIPPAVVGADVQLYWNHPDKGRLPPGEFLALAGQAGLMGALGHWMADRAATQVAAWRGGPADRLWFALNGSAREFARDRRFPAALDAALRKHGLDGARFALELPERDARFGDGESLEALKAVASLGVTLTLGEFGMAGPGLAALRQLPVRKLKVGRGLVADLATRDDAVVVVRAMAAMAGGLGLGFAAEGVETGAQLAHLQSLGCEEWRGGLYSEPLGAAAFEALLESQARAASA